MPGEVNSVANIPSRSLTGNDAEPEDFLYSRRFLKLGSSRRLLRHCSSRRTDDTVDMSDSAEERTWLIGQPVCCRLRSSAEGPHCLRVANRRDKDNGEEKVVIRRGVLWRLYISHFLSTWNMRSYEFTVVRVRGERTRPHGDGRR